MTKPLLFILILTNLLTYVALGQGKSKQLHVSTDLAAYEANVSDSVFAFTVCRS